MKLKFKMQLSLEILTVTCVNTPLLYLRYPILFFDPLEDSAA